MCDILIEFSKVEFWAAHKLFGAIPTLTVLPYHFDTANLHSLYSFDGVCLAAESIDLDP